MFNLMLVWTDLMLAANLALYSLGIYSCSVNSISSYVNYTASDVKMAAFPFKVGDYNKDVLLNYPGDTGTHMSLPYADDVVAFLFIYDKDDFDSSAAASSLRQVFESIQQHYNDTCFTQDSMHLIDASTMTRAGWWYGGLELPAVHMQTAGHTVGAAYYYQRHHVVNKPDDWATKMIHGVSANAEFGKDVRFSGVIVMEELSDASFVAATPADVAPSDAQKIALLNNHN